MPSNDVRGMYTMRGKGLVDAGERKERKPISRAGEREKGKGKGKRYQNRPRCVLISPWSNTGPIHSSAHDKGKRKGGSNVPCYIL
jgi:hypothetical protein